uniref:Uncharacterized protein n=1 Tax=Clandestinovirus TaxID=2831644 RepID=A0A8F8KLN5_9VIRU|nr:hypothetical protein KOM_12_132 [Clandestinovirus]
MQKMVPWFYFSTMDQQLSNHINQFNLNVWPYMVPIWVKFMKWFKKKSKTVVEDGLLMASMLYIINEDARYPPMNITQFLSDKFKVSTQSIEKTAKPLKRLLMETYVPKLPTYSIIHEGKKFTMPIYFWFNSRYFRHGLDVKDKDHFVRVLDKRGKGVDMPEPNKLYTTRLMYIPGIPTENLDEDSDDERSSLL